MKKTAFAVPVVITVLGVVLLAGLGMWQLERRTWKLGVIERIEARAHGEPVSLTGARERWRNNRDIDYTRVLLVGRFMHDQERHYYTVSDGQPGWDIITPLTTAGGDIVLVDRGFVPEERKAPETRKDGLVPGVVELTGIARAPEIQGWFVPDNDPAGNRWYWRDVTGLAASLRGVDGEKVTPFLVEAEALPGASSEPRGGVTRLVIPNRHLEYALTWFSLAAGLVIVFGIYMRGAMGASESDRA